MDWSTTLDWSAVTTRTLYLSLPANNPASGEPTISGTAQVGQMLTAGTSAIMDADGLAGVTFDYQWIREDDDGTNPVDITGATASTYTLASADVGKKVKVRVSFEDNLHSPDSMPESRAEMLTSAAYPPAGIVAVDPATAPPQLAATDGAVVNGATLVLTYNEALDEGSTPATSAYTVMVAGTARAVSTVVVSGRTVTLTLASAVTTGQAVTVSYVPGTNPVQDTTGNDAAALTDQAVTNNTLDTTAPALAATNPAVVSGDTLVLTYNEALDSGSTPAPDAYTVAGAARAVSNVAVSGSAVTLTLASAVTVGQTVTVSYTPGTTPVQDTSGNAAAAFTNQAVTNNTPETTPPALAATDGAVVNGATLVLTYDEALDSGSTPAPSAYTVTVAGKVRAVSNVAVSGTTVTLTLASAVTHGQTVTVSYVPAVNPVQDTTGNAAAALTNRAVTNNTANTAPARDNLIPDRTAVVGTAFTYQVPDTIFSDAGGDGLSYTAALQGGSALPAWLRFIPATRTFTGTPPAAAAGQTLSVEVTANDGKGGTATDSFLITVVSGVPQTVAALSSVEIDGDTLTLAFDRALDAASNPSPDHFTVTARYDRTTDCGTFGNSCGLFDRPGTRAWVARILADEAGVQNGKVVVRLAGSVRFGDEVRLHYDPSRTNIGRHTYDADATPIMFSDDTKLPAFANRAVENKTALSLSVADAVVREGAEAVLTFNVWLDAPGDKTVTVNYATADGTAVAGHDYTTASGTLTFAPGERKKTVLVTVLDDAHDELDETLTLRLSNPVGARISDGEAIGTITNRGPMPGAWVARLGRVLGSQVVEAVSARADGGASGSHLNVGGVSLIGGGTAWSAWGRVDSGGFQAEVDGVTMDGQVVSGMLGVDAEWERLLAGVLVLRSEADGAYNLLDGDDAGTLDSALTGVYPYARLRLGGRLSAWAVAGIGTGDPLDRTGEPAATGANAGNLTPARPGETIDTGLDVRLGALGVRGALPAVGGFDLAVKSDVLWVRTASDAVPGQLAATSADVNRLRLILEGSRPWTLSSGAVLAPTVQIGLRHDGGDAETGTGVEVGAGFRYSAGMLSVDAQVRTLLAHEAGSYEEWGASGSIRLSPNAAGLGPSLALLPSWGAPGSAAERLWSQPDASALVAGGAAPAAGRVDAELAWGLAALRGRGVLTPYARLALAEGQDRSWRLGTRLALSESLDLSLEGSSRGGAAHDLTLRATAPW